MSKRIFKGSHDVLLLKNSEVYVEQVKASAMGEGQLSQYLSGKRAYLYKPAMGEGQLRIGTQLPPMQFIYRRDTNTCTYRL